MLRFLRRYNKIILAIGGSLLLVVFIVGYGPIATLLQGDGGAGGSWATLAGEKITRAELAATQQEMLVLDRYNQLVLPLLGVEQPEHWYLLAREAEEAGLVPGNDVGRGLLDAAQLSLLRQGTGLPDRKIFSALAKWRGVLQLRSDFANVLHFSDRRLRHEARRNLQNVTAEVMTIEARMPSTPISPTDEELQAQLDAYKDVLPGAGDFGFGYKLPDRVKLEWLKISAEDIRAAVESGEGIDELAQRRYWHDNHLTRGWPNPADVATIPSEVKDELINSLVSNRVRDLAKLTSNIIRGPQRGLPSRGGFLDLPDDWETRRIAFPDLAQQLQSEAGIGLPEYQAIGDRWLELADVTELEDIVLATTDKFGTPQNLPQLVFAAREFNAESPVQIQKGVAGPALTDPEGNLYLFRIIDVDPSREPASVDEVREKLMKDLNRVAHYEELKALVPELERKAIERSILAVANEYSTAVRPLITLSIQSNPALPIIGQNTEVVEKIIDKAMQLPVGQVPRDMPYDDRTIAIPVDDALVVVVAQITANTPATVETYKTQVASGSFQNTLARAELQAGNDITDTFSYEALAKRFDFQLTRRADDDEDVDATAPPAGASTN